VGWVLGGALSSYWDFWDALTQILRKLTATWGIWNKLANGFLPEPLEDLSRILDGAEGAGEPSIQPK